ncbi:MAG: MFS transporter [Chloroflexota bacterium]|nr:MFS transporter [Chloroflexota bacterium]
MKQLSELQTFFVMWIGQLVSSTGTQMTRFALMIWAYDRTGDATTLALLGFSAFIFYVTLSPIAGVWVDRLDRRIVLLLADGCAGISTAIVLLLFTHGTLEIWHVLIYEALTGAFDAFQQPAFTAATTMLLTKEQRGRMNGLRTMGWSVTRVFAPVLGTLALAAGGLALVIAVDLLTFIAAYSTLLLIRVPKPEPDAADIARGDEPRARGAWLRELGEAYRYLRARKGLWYLILLFTCFNAVASLTYFGVFPTMILARTGGDAGALATVRAVMGIAAVVGGVAATWWVGRIKLIHGVLGCTAISFLAGDLLMGMSRGVSGWIVAGIVTEFFVPILIASKRTIIQNKVPAALQGRVFAFDGMLAEGAIPLGYLLAGPLADRVFEPAMQPGGALVDVFGGVVGTGAGAGMGVMYLGTAIIGASICVCGYLIPALRRVETDTPDAIDPVRADEAALGLDEAPAVMALGG